MEAFFSYQISLAGLCEKAINVLIASGVVFGRSFVRQTLDTNNIGAMNRGFHEHEPASDCRRAEI